MCVCVCVQVSYGDEKFPPQEQGPIVATPTAELLKRAGEIAQVCNIIIETLFEFRGCSFSVCIYRSCLITMSKCKGKSYLRLGFSFRVCICNIARNVCR